MAHIELNLDERRQFYKLLSAKLRIVEIAEIMKRHKSTLYRERKRNFWHDEEVPKASGYHPVTAQDMSNERRARQRKLIKFPELLDEVIERLKIDWSPEQIAGRLKTEPNAPHNISHETIYQFVYSKDGQERELGKLLPQRQKKHKPRYARKARGNVFPEAVSIKHRPKSVNQREEFGHWEADLMIFRRETGNANVATVIERVSRYTVLFKTTTGDQNPL